MPTTACPPRTCARAGAAKDEARTALKPLCLPHLEYVQIWRRPLHRLPVHKDVPRLLKGMVAALTDGTELYRDDGTAKPADPPSQIAAIRKLMIGLASAVRATEPCTAELRAPRWH